jgi:hypothetical protein
MANVFSNIWHYLENFFKALFGQLGDAVKNYLNEFAKQQLGKLAIDVVGIIATTMPEADGDAKRAAAIAMLKQDALADGISLEKFGVSQFNFVIESALQALKASTQATTDAVAATTNTGK